VLHNPEGVWEFTGATEVDADTLVLLCSASST